MHENGLSEDGARRDPQEEADISMESADSSGMRTEEIREANG